VGEFRVVRDIMSDDAPTTGSLLAGDSALLTLELPWRNNATNASCIPPGSYRCVIAWSHRYQRLMPRLLDVPSRDGILIHPGNTTADTDGCILIGTMRGVGGSLLYSRKAFDEFFYWLGVTSREGDVTCTVGLMEQV
jgi:hypothetical protein